MFEIFLFVYSTQPSYVLQNKFRRNTSISLYQLVFGSVYLKKRRNIKVFIYCLK